MDHEDIKVLKEDLDYILKTVKSIDIMYGNGNRQSYQYIKQLRRIVDRLNDKYPGILAAVNKTALSISLKFFVRKTSLNKVFDEFKTNLEDVTGKIVSGRAHLNMDVASRSENTYGENVKVTLALKSDSKRSMVEVIYRNDTLDNPASPEFMLLAFHALMPSYDSDIKIMNGDFCFDSSCENHDGEGFLYSPMKDRE